MIRWGVREPDPPISAAVRFRLACDQREAPGMSNTAWPWRRKVADDGKDRANLGTHIAP